MQRSAVAVAAHSAHAWDNPLIRHACVLVFRDIEGVGRYKLRWPGSLQINYRLRHAQPAFAGSVSAALGCHAPDISPIDDELLQAQPIFQTVNNLVPAKAGGNHLPRDGVFL